MSPLFRTSCLLLFLFCCGASAKQHVLSANKTFDKLPHTISGYPLRQHQDYTINGNNLYMAKLQCTFSNSSHKLVSLNLWTEPDAQQPRLTLQLKPGTTTKPFIQQQHIQLRLFKQWWCGIYVPKKFDQQLNYCAYFSIADTNLDNYHPFSIWHLPPYSTRVQYHCHITPVKNHPAGFLSAR